MDTCGHNVGVSRSVYHKADERIPVLQHQYLYKYTLDQTYRTTRHRTSIMRAVPSVITQNQQRLFWIRTRKTLTKCKVPDRENKELNKVSYNGHVSKLVCKLLDTSMYTDDLENKGYCTDVHKITPFCMDVGDAFAWVWAHLLLGRSRLGIRNSARDNHDHSMMS